MSKQLNYQEWKWKEKISLSDRCVTISDKPICVTVAKCSCFGIEIPNWITKNTILLSRDKKEKEGKRKIKCERYKVTRNREKEKPRNKRNKLKSETEREVEKEKFNKI